MAFENIERRFQRWKVIMVPGGKSYESWDEMVTGENFPEEARYKYKTHRTRAILSASATKTPNRTTTHAQTPCTPQKPPPFSARDVSIRERNQPEQEP